MIRINISLIKGCW